MPPERREMVSHFQLPLPDSLLGTEASKEQHWGYKAHSQGSVCLEMGLIKALRPQLSARQDKVDQMEQT